MKKILLLAVIILFSNCSEYEEDLKFTTQNYQDITVETVDSNLSVVHLTVNQDEFDKMYTHYEEDIEIEAYFSFYKDRELLIDNQLTEIEIKGVRSAQYQLKSIGVKFDETFDNEEHLLFANTTPLPFHSLEKIKAFRLRNSGNDFEYTMIKDASYTQLAVDANLNIDLTYYEPVLVLVNNTFLGLLNMRSEANTNGISRLNGVKKKQVTLAKIQENVIEKKDGDFDRIDTFIEAIETRNTAYLLENVDLDNFIDYTIFESFIANRDWPHTNVRFYAIDQGKFRFVLFDLDLTNTINIEDDPLRFIYNGKGGVITNLFDILYQNADFKTKYHARYEELLKQGYFTPEKFNAIVNQHKEKIEHIMPLQIEKYNNPESVTNWYRNIDLMKDYYKQRYKAIVK